MKARLTINLAILFLLVYAIGYEGIWKWGFCRVYVPQKHSLLVMYKGSLIPFLWGNPPMAEGDFAKVEDGRIKERGFLKEMVGPGRHFDYDPIRYKRILVPDIPIVAGVIGVVTSKLGGDLPAGEFLVEGDVNKTSFKGTLRNVLKPGRYRVNLYGYDVTLYDSEGVSYETITLAKVEAGQPLNFLPPDRPARGGDRAVSGQINAARKRAGWLEIEAGHVGVVTHLANDAVQGGKSAGLQETVLQPGIYTINPREEQVDVVEIGYRGIEIKAEPARDNRQQIILDENGEPTLQRGSNSGITFPSNDGYPITLDFTCIWGIEPTQAPKVIELFGNVGDVEKTVILPQIESICRLHGSKVGAVDLLTGETREAFQRSVDEDFGKVLKDKNLTLQVGLVRHIHIPAEIRGPIQKGKVAEELKLTRDTEIETAGIEATLEEAKSNVTKEEKIVIAETQRLFEEEMAKGTKEVEEIRAETERIIAAIDRETAEIEAEAKILLSEAESKVETLRQQAMATKTVLAVEAMGSPEAYNHWVFANSLPAELRLDFLYAGPGTFWTDLKGFQEAAMAKIVQKDNDQSDAPSKTASTPPNDGQNRIGMPARTSQASPPAARNPAATRSNSTGNPARPSAK